MATCELNILFTGYCNPVESGVSANCTCTLLRTDKYHIIIDTLTSWDGDMLKQKLSDLNISPEEITHCICTHGHSDHIGCNYLFKNALQFVGKNSISKEHLYFEQDFSKPYFIDESIKIIATPGHTSEDISILANTSEGLVVIAGDLFENEEDLLDDTLWKSNSEFPVQQAESRNKILEIADYIVPGHGPMFKNKQKLSLQSS